METVVRVFIIYVLIIVGLRLSGKREFSQMTPIELVMLLMIPELVAQSLVREDFSMTNAVIALSTLFVLVFVNSTLIYRSRTYERALTGEPTVLVVNGELQPGAMNKERVSAGEIFTEMHKSGVESLGDVKWAILEGDGKISVIPKRELATASVHSDRSPSEV